MYKIIVFSTLFNPVNPVNPINPVNPVNTVIPVNPVNPIITGYSEYTVNPVNAGYTWYTSLGTARGQDPDAIQSFLYNIFPNANLENYSKKVCTK